MGLPIEETAEMSLTVMQLCRRLDAWTTGLRASSTRSFVLTSALLTTASAPFLPVDALFLAARVVNWIGAVDDQLDGGTLAAKDAAAAVDRYRKLLADELPPPLDPLEAALAEIVADLASSPGAAALGAPWTRRCDALLAAMAEEHRDTAVGGGTFSDLDEYLECAVRSIGTDCAVIALWAGLPADEARQALELLAEPLRKAAVIIRLANDLSDPARDFGEGTATVLTLGISEHRVEQMIAREREEFDALCRPLVAAGFLPAIALARFVVWTQKAYGAGDLSLPVGDQRRG